MSGRGPFLESIQVNKENSEQIALEKLFELTMEYIKRKNTTVNDRTQRSKEEQINMERIQKQLDKQGIQFVFQIKPKEVDDDAKLVFQRNWLIYLAEQGLFGLGNKQPAELTTGYAEFSESNHQEYVRFIREKGIPYITEQLSESEEIEIERSELMKQITQIQGVLLEVDINPNMNEIRRTMSLYDWKKLLGNAALILLKKQKKFEDMRRMEKTPSEESEISPEDADKLKHNREGIIEELKAKADKKIKGINEQSSVNKAIGKICKMQRNAVWGNGRNLSRLPRKIRSVKERIERTYIVGEILENEDMLKAMRVDKEINTLLTEYINGRHYL